MNRLLIVEDDPELQELCAAMLEGLDCEITAVGDAAEAATLLATHPPDLLVLDILLGDVTGDVLYRQVRNDPRLADLPVVVVSVLSASDARHLMDLDRRTVFIRKPFRREQLVEAVAKGLGMAHHAERGYDE